MKLCILPILWQCQKAQLGAVGPASGGDDTRHDPVGGSTTTNDTHRRERGIAGIPWFFQKFIQDP